MSGRNDQQRDAAWLFAGMAAAMALVIAAIAVIVSNDSVGDPVTKTSTAEVSLKDSSIRPNPIVLATGMADITVHNDGTIVHNFSITGVGTTANLDAGKSTTLSVHGLAPGTYQAICTILGHAAAGMTATVTVAGGGSSAVAAAPSTPTASAATGDATIDFDATPPTDWKPFDPALKPADGAVEHKITLHATEKVIAVAPGVTQQLWTFNDQVPGPILRGKVGDLFTITLTNDGTIGHSIDFHASKVAWNDEMRTINPGQSLVYQFKADFAGIFMYHCGTPPAASGRSSSIRPTWRRSTTSTCSYSPSSISVRKANPETSRRCNTKRGTPSSSTAT